MKYIKIIIFLLIIIGVYLLNNSSNGNNGLNFLKSLLSNEKKELIKNILFPNRSVEKLIKKELIFKKSGQSFDTTEAVIKLSNNMILKKYILNSGFYVGHHKNIFPGSGYIDFNDNNIIVLSSRGVLAYKKNIYDIKENFQQIKNNIDDFIGLNQFKKSHQFSIKDLLIFNEKIYVSFTEEIKTDCWNTSIIQGDINYKNIEFRKLFSSEKCIHSDDNLDKEFEVNQSGGRIIPFDTENILLSIGDYRSRHLAQNVKSINGKIIKININNGNYQIIAMGFRNPQGLYFSEEDDFILSTEHGPFGGDEINLIPLNKNKIPNYGWPVSSAGEHYGGRIKTNELKYLKYPLYKSHAKYGFIEPLKSFVPSIGISEIVKVSQNRYLVSSMADKSIYFFELNEQKQIINFDRVELFERIRDLKLHNDKLYLFLESTASIGVINLKLN